MKKVGTPASTERRGRRSRVALARKGVKPKLVPARRKASTVLQSASAIPMPAPTGPSKFNLSLSIHLFLNPLFVFYRRENPGTDVSSSVETDKENDPMDDTDQLLDSTYNLGTTNAASIIGKSYSLFCL